MYVYLSYEGNGTNWVYFDDLQIKHTKNNVVQYNEYYPFGLQTSSSWTRENSNNDFLYNEGSELNKTTGWYETPFRNYDAALGRLTSVDPMATKYASFSGYHYAYNNPVMCNDPSGADPQSDAQTQFSYMVAMEKLRQELADMARKALLEQYPFYDVSLDPVSAAVYYGMQQEAERQREAALLARARSGDMQAIREYASTHGGLVRYEGAEAQALFSALYSMEEAKLGRRAPAGPPTPSGGQAQQGGPVITGAVINTGALSGDNNCANCGFLSNGLGTNVRPDLGYFNGVEIQFKVKGNLNGYTVKVSRTKSYAIVVNGQVQSGNSPDGPDSRNTFVSGNIYSIDSPGVYSQAINVTSGVLNFQMIGNFVETAIIQDANGNIVSQHSVQWNSSMQIGRSSPDGNFQYLGGSIGPGHVKIP